MNGKNNELCKAHSGLEQRIKNVEQEEKRLHQVDEEQWTAINQLRNRLPAWATVVISLLTFLLGIALTYASMK